MVGGTRCEEWRLGGVHGEETARVRCREDCRNLPPFRCWSNAVRSWRNDLSRGAALLPSVVVQGGRQSVHRHPFTMSSSPEGFEIPPGPSNRPLSLQEYTRYGRQMILADFGLSSQLRLKSSRVLVVGAGGLGCPSIQYLAAAGVGYITVIDFDVVEVSNLARQVLHTQDRVGMHKAQSIKVACQSYVFDNQLLDFRFIH